VISFSVIIITHGREDLLLKCLESLNQFSGEWELILIENGQKLSSLATDLAKSLTPHLRLFYLDEKSTPGSARNKALDLASGDWIFFIDDDAYLLDGYFKIINPYLASTNYDVIGGPDIPARGMSNFSMALALTLSSPFCTGLTHVRHQPAGTNPIHATEIHLSSCNLWVRRASIGDIRFPENFKRTEETAFLTDLKKINRVMIYEPKLRVGHFRRKGFKELILPTYFAGHYRSILMKRSSNVSLFFWLPSIFVILHSTLFISMPLFFYLAQIYLSLIIMMSLKVSSKENNFFILVLVILLHYFIVFIYGLGFLTERLRLNGNK
jgi:glycosyltransferase involved in cell wall biosynthesis